MEFFGNFTLLDADSTHLVEQLTVRYHFNVTFYTFKISKITVHDHNVVVLNIQDGIKIRKILFSSDLYES